jgi:hypothetical protein
MKTAVQTRTKAAVSEEDKVMIVTTMVLDLMQRNGPWSSYAAQSDSCRCKWLYEPSKHLQDLHMDVTLLSETYLKPHERLYSVVYSAN